MTSRRTHPRLRRRAWQPCPGSAARAEEVKAGDLVITQADPASPGGAKVGGAYLTIENKGSTPTG